MSHTTYMAQNKCAQENFMFNAVEGFAKIQKQKNHYVSFIKIFICKIQLLHNSLRRHFTPRDSKLFISYNVDFLKKYKVF